MKHINIENVALYEDRLKSRKLIIPVFVPHMGCPHDCCFCNQKKISGQTEAPTYEGVINLIKNYSNIATNYGSVEVAFYGGSFTAIPWEEQELLLSAAVEGCKVFRIKPDFRISTRPDYIDSLALERLKSYGVKTIELGVQSMCDEVLKLSGRGHLSQDTVAASKLIKAHGFILGIQTMPGLPGASEEDEYYTAQRVIELSPEIVRIYPTVVIRGTELAKMEIAGDYKPLELEKAVSICAQLVPMYESAGIKIIRMGLQSSDNISTDKDVISGPYHPAFGELVKSKIALDFMVSKIQSMISQNETEARYVFGNYKVCFILERGTFCIYVDDKLLSQFIGHNRSNVETLKKVFNIDQVKIKPEREI